MNIETARLDGLVLFGCLLSCIACAAEQPELVMVPGMTIEATTPSGKIVIEAVDSITRRYSWGSHSKTFTLNPRPKRWMGSKGAYRAMGDRDTHVVLEEGQQHFYSESEAQAWLAQQDDRMKWTYTSRGLVVGWYETTIPPPQKHALIAEVWQFYIQGKKPKGMVGSSDERIRIGRTNSQEAEAGNFTAGSPAMIGNREFSGKAIDVMREFNLSAAEVEDVIARAKRVARGEYFCYWGWSLQPMVKLSACTDSSGKVWVATP